jgi:hypothetical protein
MRRPTLPGLGEGWYGPVATGDGPVRSAGAEVTACREGWARNTGSPPAVGGSAFHPRTWSSWPQAGGGGARSTEDGGKEESPPEGRGPGSGVRATRCGSGRDWRKPSKMPGRLQKPPRELRPSAERRGRERGSRCLPSICAVCLAQPVACACCREEPGPRAGCGKAARPVRRAGTGNGAMGRIEAPAIGRKPPATATPRPYSHRACPRLYRVGHGSERRPGSESE